MPGVQQDVEDPIVTATKVPTSVIPVPDASFEDHALAEGGYIDVAAHAYTGAWYSHSIDAWVDNGYWRANNYPEDLYAHSGNNKAYAYEDYIYQILDDTFIEGVTYTFSVWVGQPWEDSESDWRLYFVADEHRNELIETSGTAGPAWEQISLSYTATADDAGKKIGIKMWGSSDVAFDDVELTVDPPIAPPARLTVELTLAVSDEANPTPVTDTMTIDVYDDACGMAVALDPAAIELTDLNGDCVTNLLDFAVMAGLWLDDYALTEPVVEP